MATEVYLTPREAGISTFTVPDRLQRPLNMDVSSCLNGSSGLTHQLGLRLDYPVAATIHFPRVVGIEVVGLEPAPSAAILLHPGFYRV